MKAFVLLLREWKEQLNFFVIYYILLHFSEKNPLKFAFLFLACQPRYGERGFYTRPFAARRSLSESVRWV